MRKDFYIEVSDITRHQTRKNAELQRRVGSKAIARFISDRDYRKTQRTLLRT